MLSSYLGRVRRDWFLLLVCLVGCVSYYEFFIDRAIVEVDIEVEQRTFFRIYWAGADEPFSSGNHGRVLVSPDQKHYRFYLTDLATVDRLRIDPHEYRGSSVIKRVVISQKGWQPVRFSKEEFSSLSPLVQGGAVTIDADGVMLNSDSNDPQLILNLNAKELSGSGWADYLRLATLFLLLYGAGRLTGSLLVNERYIVLSLAVIFGLVLAMAVLTRQDVHPDENVHRAAAGYYSDNLLPPDVYSEDIRTTYSRYGISRLNGHEVYYFIAGTFNNLLQSLKLENYLVLRLFNAGLLLSLLLFAVRFSACRPVFGVLLISPQLWYVFSYCNSDAFALFAGLLAGWQVSDKNSLFYRLLGDRLQSRVEVLLSLAMYGMFTGLLLMLKKNYYPLLVFLFLCVLQHIWLRRATWLVKPALLKVTIIIVLGVLLFLGRLGADLAVNGWDRNDKIAAIQTELAEPLFNPATETDKRHVFLSMKERGVSLAKIIHVHRWGEKTFRSAFGVYGYLTVSATHVYYDIIRWTAVGLLVFICGSVLLFGGWPERLRLFGALVLSTALIGASLHHSWTADFQAQGRYLFPAFVMLATAAAGAQAFLNRKLLCLLLTALFLISGYSFIAVGLAGLPKLVS